MNKFIETFFKDLNSSKVRYCHWKSVNTLHEAVEGIGDLDLLIDSRDETAFSTICAKMGFKVAADRDGSGNPYVYHYYALDPETGILVHLHVYFKLVTGGAILKNHHIQLEELFLSETTIYEDLIPVPKREADLILFVIRKMCEQPSLVEHLLYWKDLGNIRKELDWLMEDVDRDVVNSYVEKWLPFLPLPFFNRCLDALIEKAPWWRRVVLGLRMHRYFPCTVEPIYKASFFRNTHFFELYVRGKLKRIKSNRVIFPGGKIIAFVGSEASGKSTLSKEVAKWLGVNFDVIHVHMGKPPKCLLSKLLWLPLRGYVTAKSLLRQKKTGERSGGDTIEEIAAAHEPHPVVAWMDSHDRAAQIKRLTRAAMNGSIVITDRYPATEHGDMDGPRIEKSGLFGKLLYSCEHERYKRLPRPDMVFKVMAPLDITKERNAARDKPEPEDFLEMRYAKAKALTFPPSVHVYDIDTTAPLEDCLARVKQLIWTGRAD